MFPEETCVVCLSAAPVYGFLECRHMVFCVDCLIDFRDENSTSCPKCKSFVNVGTLEFLDSEYKEYIFLNSPLEAIKIFNYKMLFKMIEKFDIDISSRRDDCGNNVLLYA